jgi:hypothetical protein
MGEANEVKCPTWWQYQIMCRHVWAVKNMRTAAQRSADDVPGYRHAHPAWMLASVAAIYRYGPAMPELRDMVMMTCELELPRRKERKNAGSGDGKRSYKPRLTLQSFLPPCPRLDSDDLAVVGRAPLGGDGLLLQPLPPVGVQQRRQQLLEAQDQLSDAIGKAKGM